MSSSSCCDTAPKRVRLGVSWSVWLLSASIAFAGCAQAQETVIYSYDPLGRLTTAGHSGVVNNGMQLSLAHDSADNRTNVTVTGAAAAARVIVVPLNGFTVLAIPAQ